MMYCTHCGSDLKGSKVSCPVCGYRVDKMRDDLKQPRAIRPTESRPEERKPWAPPIPDQRKDSFRGGKAEKIKEEDESIVRTTPSVGFGTREIAFRGSEDIREAQGSEEEEVENDPTVVTHCSHCNARPGARCFFCLSPICRSHTEGMQIYVRTTAFGDVVKACPTCRVDKEGRTPTAMEADEAGMYFSIKPYHVWRRVK